eukprot:3769153-Rhodomonas_salina.3
MVLSASSRAMRCAVPTWRMVVSGVWCSPSIWRYEMSITDLVYGAMQCAVLTWRMVPSAYATAMRCAVLT